MLEFGPKLTKSWLILADAGRTWPTMVELGPRPAEIRTLAASGPVLVHFGPMTIDFGTTLVDPGPNCPMWFEGARNLGALSAQCRRFRVASACVRLKSARIWASSTGFGPTWATHGLQSKHLQGPHSGMLDRQGSVQEGAESTTEGRSTRRRNSSEGRHIYMEEPHEVDRGGARTWSIKSRIRPKTATFWLRRINQRLCHRCSRDLPRTSGPIARPPAWPTRETSPQSWPRARSRQKARVCAQVGPTSAAVREEAEFGGPGDPSVHPRRGILRGATADHFVSASADRPEREFRGKRIPNPRCKTSRCATCN